jgi:hypothetical protein
MSSKSFVIVIVFDLFLIAIIIDLLLTMIAFDSFVIPAETVQSPQADKQPLQELGD